MGSPPSNENEDADFREALRSGAEVYHALKPVPHPRQTELDQDAVLAESLAPFTPDEAMETGEELLFVRPGVSRQLLRKMRRGHWVVEAEVDLHGLTRPQALSLTDEFLKSAVKRRLRCVRIVHGKGLGVLKEKLRKWLPLRNEVLAFTQAPAAHGGSGAVLVLLKVKA